MKYNCTSELHTSIWKKFFRWLKLMKKREEFTLEITNPCFDKDYIIDMGAGVKLKIIEKL